MIENLQEKKLTNKKSDNIQLALNGGSKDLEEPLVKYIEYFDTKKKNYSKQMQEKIFSFISDSIIKKENQMVSNEILKDGEQFEKHKNFHESINKV